MDRRPSSIEPDGIFDGLRWPPILGGAVLDNVLTFFAMLPIYFYFAGGEAFSEDEEASRRALEQAAQDPGFLLLTLVVGLAITVYAGGWAARRAGALHLRHGGWTAVAAAVLATLFLLLPGAGSEPGPPWWYDVVGLALMVPAGVLGGWIASKLGPGRNRV